MFRGEAMWSRCVTYDRIEIINRWHLPAPLGKWSWHVERLFFEIVGNERREGKGIDQLLQHQRFWSELGRRKSCHRPRALVICLPSRTRRAAAPRLWQ